MLGYLLLGAFCYTFSTMKQRAQIVIFFAIVLATSYILWTLLGFPSEEEFLILAREYVQNFGLITIFLIALIEGLVVVGWYVPGGTFFFLAVIFSYPSVTQALAVVSMLSLGVTGALVIDYILGERGWYRALRRFGLTDERLVEPKEKLEKNVGKAIFFSYWQPNLASLMATAAGVLRISKTKFFALSFLATIFWYLFWGSLAFLLGEASLELIGYRLLLVIIFIWLFTEYVGWKKEKKLDIRQEIPDSR